MPAAPRLSIERVSALLDAFVGKRILVVGDVMLDRFLWGSVSRLSPEAPVPVVEVTSESAFPGGAANVARNICEMGATAYVAGRVGVDDAAQTLIRLLASSGIETSLLLAVDSAHTTVKTRVIARQQQIVRVDREKREILEGEPADRFMQQCEAILPQIDAVIIEDYAKGFVTQQIADFLGSRAHGHKLLAIDPNPANPLRWHGADVIKPNRKEAIEAASLLSGSPFTDWAAAARFLLSKWGTQSVLITLGEEGMGLLEKDALSLSPATAREVFDVSGAGDTAISVFTLARAAGATRFEAMELANRASGIVVGKLGTATVTTQELLAAMTADSAKRAEP